MRLNITIIVIGSLLVSGFTSNDKGTSEYTKLQKLEQLALQKPAGKVYTRNLTGRKDCNKTEVKYLGVIHTTKGKSYKILTSFFVFSASTTCHGNSAIKIFDMKNRYVGEYNVGMPEALPDILRNNKLVYVTNSKECSLRKTRSVNFKYGLPKLISLPCSKNGGDTYTFISGQ
jgi:hypothetical protein